MESKRRKWRQSARKLPKGYMKLRRWSCYNTCLAPTGTSQRYLKRARRYLVIYPQGVLTFPTEEVPRSAFGPSVLGQEAQGPINRVAEAAFRGMPVPSTIGAIRSGSYNVWPRDARSRKSCSGGDGARQCRKTESLKKLGSCRSFEKCLEKKEEWY